MRQKRRSNATRGTHGVGGNADPRRTFEKYITLAKAAEAAGDSVARERYYQHADHYYRVMNARFE